MFFVDVGLLAAKCDLKAETLLHGNRFFGQFKGALTEQYVQQQLRADNRISTYYWSAERAQAEVDFLFSCNHEIYPLEAKAERNLQAKSLRSFCKRYQNKLALRVSMHQREDSTITIATNTPDQSIEYTVVDIPLYAISALPDELAGLSGGDN